LAANVKGKAPIWGFIPPLFCATIPLLKKLFPPALGGSGAGKLSTPEQGTLSLTRLSVSL